jgi:D-inositol-3-phosphate glycosyltransferase
MGNQGRKGITKKKLFIVADAAVTTGFATVTHNLIEHLHKTWDIDVLAINYYGDSHEIQQKARLWCPVANQPGDVYGLTRMQTLLKGIKPDTVLFINDPWILSEYAAVIKDTPGKKIGYTPIDAKNIKPMFVEEINKVFDHLIAYTEFGKTELVNAGLSIPSSVISHGIDKSHYFPLNKADVRKQAGLDPNWYIVQLVGRNQIRKRIDLALYYFSEWVKRYKLPDTVKFYYHGALIDEGWDIGQLAQYNGIQDHLVLSHKNLNPAHGFPLEAMKLVYNLADVHFSTCQGEGWGLCQMESMACGIPQIVPDFSALGEWCRDDKGNPAVEYASISATPFFNTKGLNTQGGIPDMESTIAALHKLYTDKKYREDLGAKGYRLVTQPKFEWRSVARQFEQTFNTTQIIKRNNDGQNMRNVDDE